MNERQVREPQIDPGGIRDTLTYLMPYLQPFWHRPLEDYAKAVYDVKAHQETSFAREDARSRLGRWLGNIVLRSGAEPQAVEDALEQFLERPVIQTGPHCHLIVEPDAFYTHLFSLLGIRAWKSRWHVWYGASTVKFIEKPQKGPGWLTLGDEVVNVFGLPRRRMDSFSVCGMNGPYRFKLSRESGTAPANDAAQRLKAILPEAEFPSAAEAIKAGNAAIWKAAFPRDVDLVQIDDVDVADLVADHLEDPNSWLSERLMGGGIFVDILRTLDELDAGPWSGWIRRTTDLFWGLCDGRIRPLRLNDGVLRSEGSVRLEIDFTSESLAAALRNKLIVPNLLITFMVISILPGMRVLGGCRQTVYYPLMRYAVAKALAKNGEWELLDSLRADVLLGVWGHRVLKPDCGDPFAELEASGRATDLLPPHGAGSLMEACGNLASFTNDPIWAELSRHIASGVISSASSECQWCQSPPEVQI